MYAFAICKVIWIDDVHVDVYSDADADADVAVDVDARVSYVAASAQDSCHQNSLLEQDALACPAPRRRWALWIHPQPGMNHTILTHDVLPLPPSFHLFDMSFSLSLTLHFYRGLSNPHTCIHVTHVGVWKARYHCVLYLLPGRRNFSICILYSTQPGPRADSRACSTENEDESNHSKDAMSEWRLSGS